MNRAIGISYARLHSMPIDIANPPNIIEIPVTFLDIMYVGGIPDSITLRDGDELEVLADNIYVVVKNPPVGKLNGDEKIYIERRNVLSFRLRHGVIRKIVPPTRPSANAASESTQSPNS